MGDAARSAGSNERQRRIFLSAATDLFARATSIAVYFIAVRLTLGYLGEERFGLFATLFSFVTLFSFADLGIGNGLLSFISRAQGDGESIKVREYFSTAAVVLLTVSALVLLILSIVYPWVPWPTFYKLNTQAAIQEAGPATAVLVCCIALGLPLSSVYKVQLALQSGFIANLWQAAGSVLALIGVGAVVYFQGTVTALIGAFVGAPLLVALANNVWFFCVKRRDLRPSPALARMTHVRRVLKEGGMFFVLQIAVALAFLSDSLVIARTIGAKEVAVYALCATIFSCIQIAMSIMLTPLWPAYGEAIARSDVKWIRKVLGMSIAAALLVPCLLGGPLVVWNEEILRLWTGQPLVAPLALLIGLAVWRAIEAIGNAAATYLNASNIIAEQVVLAIAMSTVAIVAKVYFAREFGISGVVWATILAYLSITAIPQYRLVKRALRATAARPPA